MDFLKKAAIRRFSNAMNNLSATIRSKRREWASSIAAVSRKTRLHLQEWVGISAASASDTDPGSAVERSRLHRHLRYRPLIGGS